MAPSSGRKKVFQFRFIKNAQNSNKQLVDCDFVLEFVEQPSICVEPQDEQRIVRERCGRYYLEAENKISGEETG